MFEPKIPAFAASIGFVLSLLIGLASGAAFGIVLARAFGMGLLFAVLAFGGWFIIMRFLPELVEFETSEDDLSGNTGSVIDITVGDSTGDENPFITRTDGTEERMVPDFMENSQRYDEEFESVSSGGDDIGLSDEIVKPAVNNGPSAEVSHSGSDSRTARPKSSGGLDVLPDLQDFIPQVSASTEESDGDGSAVYEGTGLSQSIYSDGDSKASTMESETMAKAIRTILTRDS